jgi:predicted Zn-dependent peptidase
LLHIPKTNRPQKSIFVKNFQQSHLLFTTRTDGLNSKDRYIYAIINNLLGEGLSSRLNQVLREKYGYVYSVYSTLALLRDVGTMSIYAASELKNIHKVENLIIKELELLGKIGFTEKEIKSAKEQIKSSTIIGLDGVSSKMQSLARIEAVNGEYESINDTINLIDDVSNEEVFRAIKKHLAPKKWSEVILQTEQ